MKLENLAAVASTVFAITALLGGCGTDAAYAQAPTQRASATSTAPSCDDVFGAIIEMERSAADYTEQLNDLFGYFSERSDCGPQWDVLIGYVSNKGMLTNGYLTCADLLYYNQNPLSIELLRQDGLCEPLVEPVNTPPASPAVQSAPQPATAPVRKDYLDWDEAYRHIGTYQVVCGPLASTGGSNDDVFLNLGKAYPNPDRFTVVLWDVGRIGNLPIGTTVCATGTIDTYKDQVQIQVWDINQVQVSN